MTSAIHRQRNWILYAAASFGLNAPACRFISVNLYQANFKYCIDS